MTASNDDFEREVRMFAGEIVSRAENDPVARLGIMHAATMLITAMAIEEDDPAATIEALVGDIHTEATAMIDIVRSGKLIAENLNNVIQLEKLQ